MGEPRSKPGIRIEVFVFAPDNPITKTLLPGSGAVCQERGAKTNTYFSHVSEGDCCLPPRGIIIREELGGEYSIPLPLCSPLVTTQMGLDANSIKS